MRSNFAQHTALVSNIPVKQNPSHTLCSRDNLALGFNFPNAVSEIVNVVVGVPRRQTARLL
jgi:hypothetical protein